MSRTPLLVLGLGNVLLEDDGVGGGGGRAAARSVSSRRDGVRVLDGGTLGLSLLPYLEEADAVDPRRRRSGPTRRRARSCGSTATRSRPAVATRLSPHQVGVADLLDGARWLDRYPERVVLLGLVPESMELARRACRRAVRAVAARPGRA